MPPKTDFSTINDEMCYMHPAYAKFVIEMEGKCYGEEALNDAWLWYKSGWDASAMDIFL